MKLMVREFMGLRKGDFQLDGLVLIAANNKSGKTSLAKAYAATLTGNMLPYKGLIKKNAKELVNDAAEEATLYYEDANGRIRVDYPRCERKTDGRPIEATPYAVGLQSLLDADDLAERGTLLFDLLKLEITKEDFEPRLVEIGCTEKELTQFLLDLKTLKVEGTLAQAKERGARLKGQWQQVTGQPKYGSVIAGRWEPPMWTPEMKDWDERLLDEKIKEAQNNYERLLKVEALTELEKQQLQDLADQVPARTEAVNKANQDYKDSEQAVAEATKVKDAYKVSTELNRSQPCPYCKSPLACEDGKIVKSTGKGVSAEELQLQLEKSAELTKALAEAQTGRDVKKAELQTISNHLNEALSALRTIERVTEIVHQKPDVEGARVAVVNAEKLKKQWHEKKQADSIHKEILRLVQVCALLEPTGLKAEKLNAELKQVNERLRKLSNFAGWSYLVIAPDFSMKFGGQPIWKISGSELFCAKVLLQILIAGYDGSQTLVIDAADILVKDGRNELFRLLSHVGLPALVTMSFAPSETIPDLAQSKMGRTYLIVKGEAELYTKREEKAA